MFDLLIIFIFSLCWGSFLNVVAYRTTYDKPFFTTRSLCPSCNRIIFWFDNLPIISWVFLKGRCRFCKKRISILYPFVELLSGIIFTSLYFYYPVLNISMVSYFVFFSALIVATRTDLQAMVIPQLFSLWLVPVGISLSFFGLTQISILESLLGAVFGYGILWVVAVAFKYFTKKDGLGVGDMELLAMIGSFLGPLGVWFALLIGSLSGLLIGGGYLVFVKGDKNRRIPFGPFLALGATLFFFFRGILINLLVS